MDHIPEMPIAPLAKLSECRPKRKQKPYFINRLLLYRCQIRVPQQELAEAIGISRRALIQLEKGRCQPTLYVAYKIARYFNTKIEAIFTYREEPVLS